MARTAKPVALCGDSRLTKADIQAREEAEQRYKGVSNLVYQCPEDLTTDRERELYMFIVNQLKSAGILNDLDIEMIKSTVFCIIHMNDANASIRDYGSTIESSDGKIYKNPAVGVYKDFYTMFVSSSVRLGLSPSDRAKLAVIDIKNKEKEEDPLLKALRERNND